MGAMLALEGRAIDRVPALNAVSLNALPGEEAHLVL